MDRLGTVDFLPNILINSKIGLWAFELDEDSQPRMYVDDVMLDLLGIESNLSPEETYLAWYDNVDPDYYQEVSETMEQMKLGTHAEVQYQWHHPNGEEWTVRCGGVRNYSYTAGIRIEGTHQNVTKVAQFEKIQRNRLREIIGAMFEDYECLAHVDFESGIEDHFRVSERLSKVIPEWASELSYAKRVKLLINNFILSEDKEQFIHDTNPKVVLDNLKSGKPYILYYRLLIGGGVEWFRVKYVHHISHGDKKCVLVGIANIDEVMRKRLKSIAIIEAIGKDFSSISYINTKTMEEVIYKSEILDDDTLPGWFEAKSFAERVKIIADRFVHPEDKERFIRENDYVKLFADLYANPVKYVNYRACLNGRTIYYQNKYVLVAIEGVQLIVVGHRNIDKETCEKLAYQEELKAAKERAEAANASKSTFLFNMSHDIRTPMNAIMGFNQMALQHIDDKEKTVEYLEKSNASSEHLLAVINDILDMARIESGKVKNEVEPVCLTDEAEELMEIIRTGLGKAITLESDFSDIKHNYAFTDKLHVNRIFTHILNNAVKYTQEGGFVKYTIKEKPSDVDGLYSYEFIIEDNGIGMSEEFLGHIFDAFEREKSSTLSGVQGTGLGMAIAKSLVDMLGGTIHVESERKKGTKVTVMLDMEATSPKDVAIENNEDEIKTSFCKGKRVLLVDDNPLNREIAEDLLTDFGLLVETAEDGKQAVDKYEDILRSGKADYYDMILMDIQMPVMNGYEATRVIRSMEEEFACRIPIIAVTANAFEEDKEASYEAGMDAHLMKPVNSKDLLKVFRLYF